MFLKCPIEHVQIAFDAANATTGLLVNYNIGPVKAMVKITGYVQTQPTSGTTLDLGHHATSGTRNNTFADGITNITGTIFGPGFTVPTNPLIVAADEYITVYNIATDTITVATAIVGYLDLEIIRYPVRVGDQ
jgi:hypothetical protein